MPAFLAALTTSSTWSGPPMLPGLMRTAATPASIAFNASEALKWMSAITGTGENRTIFFSASASSIFGTAQRTISQPAEASAAICAVVASTSCVFVSVIDCTTTGAPPPILTPPSEIWCELATRNQSNHGGDGRSSHVPEPGPGQAPGPVGTGLAAGSQAPPLGGARNQRPADPDMSWCQAQGHVRSDYGAVPGVRSRGAPGLTGLSRDPTPEAPGWRRETPPRHGTRRRRARRTSSTESM